MFSARFDGFRDSWHSFRRKEDRRGKIKGRECYYGENDSRRFRRHGEKRKSLLSFSFSPLSFPRSFNFQSNSRSVYIRAVIVKFEMLFFIREVDFITAESFKCKRKEACANMHRNEVNGWSGNRNFGV